MKIIDAAKLAGMAADAARAPRLRTHFTLHDDLSDPVQRVVIALQPGTYIRPHRHADGIWELFTVLQGALSVLIFDDGGTVHDRIDLRPGHASIAQVPPGAWHCIVVTAPDTVALEVKPGPYRAITDKGFAAWAPAEGEDGAAAMVRWMETAHVGTHRDPPRP